MTLTIDLTPREEQQLTNMARQEGLEPTEAARKLFTHSLFPASREREAQLVEEYHRLVSAERHGRLSEALAERRRQVEAELDDLEAQDPQEQAMDRRRHETGAKLDEVLELLRGLPQKEAGAEAAGQ